MFTHTALWMLQKSYLCIVFFIVLDLRLTKVGVRRYPFFYAPTSREVLQSIRFSLTLQ